MVSVIVTMIMMNNKSTDVDSNLNQETVSTEEGAVKMSKMSIEINNEKFAVDLEENSTVSALVELLPLTVSMNDLNGNEKYVYLDSSLPANAYKPQRVEAGDVMLYGDDCLVIFYDSFDTEYSYTKIGHIDSLPELGDGKLIVEFSTE